MHISLCLLTFNELEGCKRDVPLLDRSQFAAIYAVDGGSTDGTVEFLSSLGIPVFRQPSPGYNVAIRHAFDVCKTDAVVVFFPKSAVPYQAIYKFKKYLESGYDFVVASRMLRGGRAKEDDNVFKPRKWSGIILARCISVLWRRSGITISDPLHGIRATTVRAFTLMDISSKGASADLEMVVRAYRKNIPRIEFSVREKARTYGDTHFKFYSTGSDLLRFLIREVFLSITRPGKFT